MGFFNIFKKSSKDTEKNKQVNNSVEDNTEKTTEQSQKVEKNNKKGKLALLWTVISIIVYLLGFFGVASAWESNIGVGIMSLLIVLMITPLVHRKAISLAQEHRRITGKGRLVCLLAIVLPFIVLAGGAFFFFLGGMYIF